MMAPCGKPMKASRFGVEPAGVCAHAVAAGFIASRSGSAMLAPTPFNTVRRETCFLNTCISLSVCRAGCDRRLLDCRDAARGRSGLRNASHPELLASNHCLDQGREPVV